MKNILLFLAVSVSYCWAFSQDPKIFTPNEVDSYPYFKDADCPDKGSKGCFTEQIKLHISTYFKYPMEALEKQWTGSVYVQFVVDTAGTVTDIRTRSQYEVFEKEAQRIIRKIPILKAAELGGKQVPMVYSFPIDFNVIFGNESYLKKQTTLVDFSKVAETKILSYDETFKPPVYHSRTNVEGAKCFKRTLIKDIEIFVRNKEYRSKTVTSAKVYFELDSNKQISNLNVISSQKELQTLIENFFKNPLKMENAAKDKDGSSTPCYFTADIFFDKQR